MLGNYDESNYARTRGWYSGNQPNPMPDDFTMAQLREKWGRIYYPQNYTWDRPTNADEPLDAMRWGDQGYPHNLATGGILGASLPLGQMGDERTPQRWLLFAGGAHGLTETALLAVAGIVIVFVTMSGVSKRKGR